MSSNQALKQIDGTRNVRYSRPIIESTANYQEKPGSVFWYNPVTQRYHLGDVIQNEPEMSPDWNNFRNMPWIVDLKVHKQAKSKEANGELAAGEADFAGFNPEYEPKFAEYKDMCSKEEDPNSFRAYTKARELMAGVFSRADFPQIVATIQSIKMMIVGKPQHVIRDLFTNIATEKLTLKVGLFTDFDAIQENLGEFNIPYEGGHGAYSFQTMNLTKRAWHMAFSEEFGMTDYTEPVEQQHMNALNGQMDLIENKRVYDQVLAVTGTAQGDWSAFTANLSTRNPRPDIDALIGSIDDLHKAQVTQILSSRKVANAYRQNTYINGSPSIVSNPPSGVGFVGRSNVSSIAMPLLDGISWAVDSLVPTTWYSVFSPESMLVATGPSRTASYFDTKSGIRGTIFKKWFGAKVVYPDLIARGTGVAT
jgi:hypothetical protein